MGSDRSSDLYFPLIFYIYSVMFLVCPHAQCALHSGAAALPCLPASLHRKDSCLVAPRQQFLVAPQRQLPCCGDECVLLGSRTSARRDNLPLPTRGRPDTPYLCYARDFARGSLAVPSLLGVVVDWKRYTLGRLALHDSHFQMIAYSWPT